MEQEERRPSQQHSRECTILIADDDSVITSLLADVLRQHQFAVVTAADGVQALSLARDYRDKIDVLLTDIEMPHMNGFELVAAVRQFLPDINVVLMSGSSTPDAGDDVVFLRKPFTHHVLLETIAGLLGRADSQGA